MTELPSCLPPAADNIVAISSASIDTNAILANANHASAGGIVLFSGTVRNHHAGKEVSYLEYEAFEALALPTMEVIVRDACQRWSLCYAHCTHRIGRLEIGECAIVVVTAHAHRAEAYAANQYIMDKIKLEAPIWKNEFYADGSSQWGR